MYSSFHHVFAWLYSLIIFSVEYIPLSEIISTYSSLYEAGPHTHLQFLAIKDGTDIRMQALDMWVFISEKGYDSWNVVRVWVASEEKFELSFLVNIPF